MKKIINIDSDTGNSMNRAKIEETTSNGESNLRFDNAIKPGSMVDVMNSEGSVLNIVLPVKS